VFAPFVWGWNLLSIPFRRRDRHTTFLQHDTVLQTTRFNTFARVLQRERDSEGRLHAEGKPAIVYDDGSREYYYHGVELLDPRYWVHPRKWRASWLLTEFDPEHFNVLIEEIGYARACLEFATREFDSWREYTLLEFIDLIDPNDDNFIRVLKMTCPSTGSVHATRVPPLMISAREAIRWVNWGTAPEEFVVET
ncbi:MAG: hypothetical protein F6K35_47640, partial [Okeania sp. SIO2H7]|nr:hypothetical protein [Okeania sp. SIO2H7]